MFRNILADCAAGGVVSGGRSRWLQALPLCLLPGQGLQGTPALGHVHDCQMQRTLVLVILCDVWPSSARTRCLICSRKAPTARSRPTARSWRSDSRRSGYVLVLCSYSAPARTRPLLVFVFTSSARTRPLLVLVFTSSARTRPLLVLVHCSYLSSPRTRPLLVLVLCS